MPENRPDPADVQHAARARLVGIVLAATMILWMGAQWVGGQLGLETRYAFLFDLAAIAAFVWAMVVTYQIWRGRQG
jgi:Family of unknown function (DUF5337)